MTNRSPDLAVRWTREQIRAARLTPLAPLLERRGLPLVETGSGNFLLSAFPGLIGKDCYWRWPERDLAGNTIDFFVTVLGRLLPRHHERDLSAVGVITTS